MNQFWRKLLQLLLFAALAMSALPARADDNRPLTVTVVAGDAGKVRVTWKIPANVEAAYLPRIAIASGCTVAEGQRNWSDPMGHWREELWQCAQSLNGKRVQIDYPQANPNLATIVRFTPAVGADPQTILLQPQETSFVLPVPGEDEHGLADFLVLGIEHIWIGIDHLLFVAGLIFIAGTLRRVLVTITGFTIAHSLTLGLAALDIVRLPIAAVEGAIALSIVFLAVEIVKGPRDTLTWRQPIVVASTFGLLHGFGFAAVLAEIGLPREGLVAALLAFNLGVELGQVAFAALVLAVLRGAALLTRQRSKQLPIARLAGYVVGTLASFWMFQRLLS